MGAGAVCRWRAVSGEADGVNEWCLRVAMGLRLTINKFLTNSKLTTISRGMKLLCTHPDEAGAG